MFFLIYVRGDTMLQIFLKFGLNQALLVTSRNINFQSQHVSPEQLIMTIKNTVLVNEFNFSTQSAIATM